VQGKPSGATSRRRPHLISTLHPPIAFTGEGEKDDPARRRPSASVSASYLLRYRDVLSGLDACGTAAHTREVTPPAAPRPDGAAILRRCDPSAMPGRRADTLGQAHVKSTARRLPLIVGNWQSRSRSQVLTQRKTCMNPREGYSVT
jgi:hypothetical protein